ncbi:MAG: penicillin acylase family protein, partial [Pseudomonadota bacterium]
RAVPHIYAKTEYDAYFGLGFAHAQDRLWQMEFRRRLAQGRVTELAGFWGRSFGAQDMLLRVDTAARSIDLYGASERSLEIFSPDIRDALQAYSDGVNAWLEIVDREARGSGAPELLMLGATVEPWRPVDSVAAFKLLSATLSGSFFSELNRARFLIAQGPARTADLFPDAFGEAVIALPPYSERRSGIDDGPIRFATVEHPNLPPGRAEIRSWRAMAEDLPAPLRAAAGDVAAQIAALADAQGFAGASNAWAAAAERTAARAPLLASDPHLALTAPGIWYMARLEFGDGGVIGGTIAGIPAILAGRNERIAWGPTTLYADVADIYIEEINPEDPSLYRTPDGWAAFETREAQIPLGDGSAVTVTLRRTRHGPVLPVDFEPLAQITPAGHAPAVSWTVLDDRDRSLEASMRLMRGKSVVQAATLQELVVAPPQNITIADRTQIGMFSVGAAPLRRADSLSRGRVPSQGWVAANDWVGRLSPDDLPAVLAPESGLVANANNKSVDAPFPRHVGSDWPEPYRIQRLSKLLNNREFHTLSGFQAIQNDTVSEMARAVLPLLAGPLWRDLERESGQRREALERLARWNGDMDAFLAEPLIFVAWTRAAVRRLAEDELQEMAEDFRGVRPLFLERVLRDVDGAAARWCDDVSTPETESCEAISSLALDDALAELTEAYGERIDAWRWGRAHRAVHRHQPLGFVGALSGLVNIVHETGGSDHTILRGRFRGRGEDPYANVHAGGYRAIYDFADLDRSVFSIATGQSGHFFSRHYDDFAETWRQGEYAPLSLSRRDAEAAAIGVLRLIPR